MMGNTTQSPTKESYLSIKNYPTWSNEKYIFTLNQLCPTRCPLAACGPVEGFVRPSLRFRCS